VCVCVCVLKCCRIAAFDKLIGFVYVCLGFEQFISTGGKWCILYQLTLCDYTDSASLFPFSLKST